MDNTLKILHLCSYFKTNKLYKRLIESLDKYGITQYVYVPCKDKADFFKNSVNFDSSGSGILYSLDEKRYDKLFFKKKIKRRKNTLTKKLDLDYFDLIHAHTTFSDGVLALNFKQSKNVKYITTIRNTDINYFFKYAIHLRKLGIDVIKESERTIFITPMYKDNLLKNYLSSKENRDLLKKFVVMPNSVDNFWLKNRTYTAKTYKAGDYFTLLFVGSFVKNKNIFSIFEACSLLSKKGYKIKLILVGNGPLRNKLKKKIDRTIYPVKMFGYVKNKFELANIYRMSHALILPSFRETFGLVYIESISQSTPVVYSKNQGIDGYFEDRTVGERVNPRSIEDISHGIEMVIKNYHNYSVNCSNIRLEYFSSREIARKYIELYKRIIQKNY